MKNRTFENKFEDISAIKELNARYNFAIDECESEDWAQCFTEDGVFNALLEGHTPTGTEELRAFVKVCNEAFGNMRHLTTNEIINVSGNSATQKCYLLFFNDLDNRVEGHICVYNDTLVRQDGEWKYSRRDVELKMKYSELTQSK